MAGLHGPFKALGPISWESAAQDDPKSFLTGVFADAQCLVDSIPLSLASAPVSGRPRSHTDTSVGGRLLSRDAESSDTARELRKQWKEVKLNPRENPLGINVYKLGAKDGKGAWFARRSLHDGLTFEKWKLGIEKEFAESLKTQGAPGSGKIRGIGADKRVVNQVVDGCGRIQGERCPPVATSPSFRGIA